MTAKKALLALAILAIAVSARAEDKRVALVLGNSAYQKVQALRNSTNDAADMSVTLKRMGYEVLKGVDLDRKAMRSLIDDFNVKIRGADVALFYYSGHGVQVDGENYLVPISAEVGVAGDVPEECVSLTRLTARMNEAGAKTNVIILDACRDNPFKAVSRGIERGLAVVGQKPPESIIVYATSENEKAADGKGRNGVFTKALLDNIERPESFLDILLEVSAQVREATGDQQKPAVYQNLTRRIYLTTARAPASTAVPAPSQQPTPSASNVDPQSSLIAWYKFDETEGKVAADSSGNGKDGTLVGGKWVPGKVGNALRLNGNGQFVKLPPRLTKLMKEFTIAFWIKPASFGSYARAFDFGSDTLSYLMFAPCTRSQGWQFTITKGGWQAEHDVGQVKHIPTGEWTHVAITLAGDVAIAYIDGKEAARNEYIDIDPSTIPSPNNYLGKSEYSNDPYLFGALDDFRIYGKALNAQEIAAIRSEAGEAK